MKVCQYREADMRRAMRAVRDELGPDAVIISTRKVDNQVEVLAAVDYDASLATSLQAHLPGSGEVANTAAYREQAAAERTAPATSPGPAVPELDSMRAELARLRGLFEGELSELAWQEKGRRQPGRLSLQKQLEELGLSRELCQRLLDDRDLRGDADSHWEGLLEALAGQIPVCNEDLMNTGGRIALVGSTGVGKTTTVAKLAARFALRHGRNEVALITTDRFRVGAQEQLYTFGSLLGVPVQAATTAADLSRALQSVARRKLVLIDTAGMSHRDMGLTDQFATLAGVGEAAEIKAYLVQSAIAQQQVLQDNIKAFSHVGLSGVIVTKVDEAASLGPVISTLCRHDLPLAFIGNGQRVPEDILEGRSSLLVEEAVKLARLYQETASYDQEGTKQYV